MTMSPGRPQNSIIGGASLWVLPGKKPVDYKGVAKSWLSCRNPRSRWNGTRATGYVPITMAAYEMTRKSGFYDKIRAPTLR
jgi:sn-glycerol 3-phosphate transport system substrate-binding protein